MDTPAFIKAREFLRTYAVQVARGLAYIHGNGLVHRDLKLDNILMKRGAVKIADLGLAKPMEVIAGTSRAGALMYAAPEKLRGEVYNCKADIYSFGLLLWEMWYGIYAFQNFDSADDFTFVEKIKDGVRPDVTGRTAPSGLWAAMMEECWHGDPNKRPAAHTISERLQDLR
ncbi:serine/threonine-protein kinase STY13-like [Branchiostoma floridae]|uniref:Serine/threonine-protein kinase STY13-like n=1 Tax=Branchiostoma floridae TaxID=7739 RepID=A0A9J7KNC1_BRAFL|nr:serine/threonine-protein kinase STY13-like [Branchiostoma floridae]